MTNRELFLAISDVVKHEVSSVKTELRSDLGKEIQAVRSDLGREIDSVKEEVDGIKQELGEVKEEVSGIKQELGEVKEEVDGIKQELGEVKADVKKINLKLEMEIEPNIRLLAENYVPAAKRYVEASASLEILQSDRDLVKRAVESHSGSINEYGEILKEHSEILNKHGEQLDKLVKLA